MSTVNPSGIPLNQTTLTGRRNQTVTVTGIRKRYKIDKETQVRTEELDGFTVDVPMRNGIQSVKLPSEAMDESTFTKIDDALKSEKVVKVNFGTPASTLKGKFYALISKSTGQLMQGISCTATEINLVAVEDPEYADYDDIVLD